MDGPNINQMQGKYVSSVNTERDMLSLRGGAVLIIIGIILFFVGVIMGQFLLFAGDYSSAKIIYAIGRTFALIGNLMVVTPLYILGITSQSIEWKLRATMISSATAILIVTMIIGISMNSISPYMFN